MVGKTPEGSDKLIKERQDISDNIKKLKDLNWQGNKILELVINKNYNILTYFIGYHIGKGYYYYNSIFPNIKFYLSLLDIIHIYK